MILSFIFLIIITFVILFLIISFFLFFIYQVPYLPISQKEINFILNQVSFAAGKKLYDLGCGDGRFLISACRQYKILGYGWEINPFLYLASKIKSLIYHQPLKIFCQNFFQADLSQADYFFLYLMPSVMKKLALQIFSTGKKGALIISYKFSFPDLPYQKKLTHKNSFGISEFYLYQI